MKCTLFLICLILVGSSCLVAQEYKALTVKAGTRVKDYFPVSQRYVYPDFTQGKVIFKNRMIIPSMFNFNIISGEMEFIKSKDTLLFTTKKEIDLIVVGRDSFYYQDAYLQLIRSGLLSVYLKRSMAVKNILKQGAMGTVNRSAASEAYNFVVTGQISIDLKPAEDMVLQRTDEFFISTSGNDFFLFNKKNSIRILPGREESIRNFIKINKVDFDSQEDLFRLADFVSGLISESSKKK